ncbi:cyclic nucleotide-binding domain-containing protein [Rhizobium sp. L1K21]|uniref:cyclic nucleotide-binding domain-containing protein n=1 Tax=Rhizobium sp. L1K21 TaxID=2954933 RepID=UPI0020929AFA|nr:cyclic nucleotide-binding domain-containing protein [Rhizobium sp. L1K21]MCO6188104.1 cyclic nucleotide-binding domain-containing protein [Rhizobium sp. L1K21]
MALKDDIAVLSRVPVFSGMNEEQIRLLAFGAEKRHIAEGQTLFREGEPADCAYLILSGHLVLKAANGAEQDVQPGALLSEIAMVSPIERKFSAFAAQDSQVMRITRELFVRLLEEFPEAAAIVEARIRDNLTSLLGGIAAQKHRFS